MARPGRDTGASSGQACSRDVAADLIRAVAGGAKTVVLRSETRQHEAMKGVFEISGTSRYDDLIAERYHFPRIYLRAAEAASATGSSTVRRGQVAVAWLTSQSVACAASTSILPTRACSMPGSTIFSSSTDRSRIGT